jgi:murein DD-endopeptidase MepM/ murein hydrolase activator NlpD
MSNKLFSAYAFILLSALWVPLHAAAADPPPRFALPLECQPNKNCFIQNLFDHDPSEGYRDYHCGTLSYNGHTGTDIRLPDLRAMQQGVAVLAAANGKVRAVRDGMEDRSVRETGKDAIRGREAGNSVLIDHGDGWLTLYAHMKNGSVAVAPGDSVVQGTKLGLVGLSGNTEFPHLHFEVKNHSVSIDPFTSSGNAVDCPEKSAGLWNAETDTLLQYVPTGVLAGGFVDHPPTQEEVLRGDASLAGPMTPVSPALVFWVNLFGMQAGDTENVKIFAPDGSLFAQKSGEIDRSKAQWLSLLGRKNRAGSWPAGVYRGEYRLTRMYEGRRQEVLKWSASVTVK